jgi:hypothetical protein
MNELAYKILLAAIVIAMNLIRMYYQKRYTDAYSDGIGNCAET